ncbi:MAG: peptide chain release factor 2 [Candidatus Levybacteria bacterium]|nr:peptide chain release factor 2 [Candidatus Levybacteria bacterium]MBI3093055.1 peptide chain release factor 2 [Candidatus Levybacteria bacterium]
MEELRERVNKLLGKLNIEEKKRKARELEKEAADPSFWKDRHIAAEKMKELANLQKEITEIEELQELIASGQDEKAQKLLEKLEVLLYFSGPYDEGGAILSIHSGQGGVEAMDWAQMLYRMYARFFERKGWSFEVIEETPGEEAGVKSVAITVDGKRSYGYLKGEAGVHRLVRQSPFNADKLRQTSFALVEVLPQIAEGSETAIKEDDLEWEFYRASSKGGQNVQKVSSAVRLRHKPSGIVVTAQSERYQGQNREYALRVLRAKLWLRQEEERKIEEQKLRGEYKTPGWGNQIRSYVLHPYHMVKDLRTGFETSNTEAVLDGDLDGFIEAELRGIGLP